MSVRRFMIKSSSVCDGRAVLEGEICNHITRVLRMGVGDHLLLVDEHGSAYNATIELVAKRCVEVVLSPVQAAAAEDVSSEPRITICQALPKGEKIDLILQKCTELGAHDFVLFGGRRSVAKVREEQLLSKLDRWNRITSEAARQCGRYDVPQVLWRKDAGGAADSGQQLRLILWEDEKECSLKKILSVHEKPASVAVAIGPEGGFEQQEVELFRQNGYQPVTLGTRILRTETASIAILAILQYMWGAD